jgi:hypothetical protein
MLACHVDCNSGGPCRTAGTRKRSRTAKFAIVPVGCTGRSRPRVCLSNSFAFGGNNEPRDRQVQWNVADLDLVPHSGRMLIHELISANDQRPKPRAPYATTDCSSLPATDPSRGRIHGAGSSRLCSRDLRGESSSRGCYRCTQLHVVGSVAGRPAPDRRCALEREWTGVFDCEITGPDLHAGARLTVITTNSLDDLGATT